MSQEDLKAELETLKAEVAALKRVNEDLIADSEDEGAPSFLDDIEGQIHTYVDRISKEVKEKPVVATVGIFSLGILLGRFLK